MTTSEALQAERKTLVQMIHIAKKALALDESSYRGLLMRVTNVESCAVMQVQQLRAVVAEFKRLGFKSAPGKHSKPTPRNGKVRVIYAIWGEMASLLDDPSPAALRGFVKRQTGVDGIDWLNDAHCNQVIEGLRGWRENLKKGRST